MINNIISSYTSNQPVYSGATTNDKKENVPEFEIPDAVADEAADDTADERTTIEKLAAYKAELFERIKNNDTEPKFQIGNSEYSIKEWDKLIERFDEAEENLEAEVEEREERLSEEEMQKLIAQQ